jgi:alpha-L-fucosidase 2
MHITLKTLVICTLILLSTSAGRSQEIKMQHVKTSIDWEQFLGRHDLKWSKMATQWDQAPFLGNGMMGTMVRQTGKQTVRWDVGRGDVQNHRRGSDIWGISRLPIGHFELHTVGEIKGGDMHLDLWNAEASGTIRTEKGTIKWRSFVHADLMVIVTEIEPSEGERECRWQWNPEKAICPRLRHKKFPNYRHNPPFTQGKDGEVQITVQPLAEGGETVTAWQTMEADGKTRLMVSVAHSHPEKTAQKEAVDVIKRVHGISLDALTKSHREWWHAYYPISFVSLPDTWWESFYWIQMYKLASGTRADRMLLDLQGPWPQPTPWPACWWNLNIQLTYWPSYDSGRLDIGDSLCRTLYDNVDNLIENVPEKYRGDAAGVGRVTGQHCVSSTVRVPGSETAEFGNLVWACHNCWLHYRHTMDDERLRKHLFPLLKRSVNFYLHFLKEEEDGKLHLPKTYSPEYNFAQGPDCNYDLALLRWGCAALIQACERLKIDDSLLPKWKEVLEKLTDYPKDKNGYMIARGVPFAKGHRHFSHLLMNYPLYQVNVDQPGAKALAVKSVRHWQSRGARQGYSLTGASSVSSAYGLGNDALRYLNGLKRYLRPNTMYKESGPVIETPLSGAQSIHDMLLQSWGGTIRAFPAVADAWSDLAFHDLRTEGAFLVSAKRKDGKTLFVRIKSLKGEPCIIMPALDGKIQVSGNRKFELKEIKQGRYSLDLKQGEEAILWSGDQMPDLTISPLPAEPGKSNSFGLR